MTPLTSQRNHIWVTVGAPEDVPAEGGVLYKVIRLEDPPHPREIAVFRVGGGFAAVDARCPHKGARLDRCRVDLKGAIECPLHHWRFDLRTGACEQEFGSPLEPYPVSLFGGRLKIRVPVDTDALPSAGEGGEVPGE